ncbi:MAG: lipoprotein insertase outer membrane protein LolB [Gammaproteobacteria bacterium]|nr:lipoprotein insertase outer membrane protein LolB [Gammaproteobacteria bacterium]
MHRNTLFLIILLPSTLLSACAVLPPLGDGLAADFRLRGKIGVRDQSSPAGSFSASFDWIQAGDAFAIELWGPLGQGRTRLTGDDEALTVTDAHGVTLAGKSPEALMQEHLGWSAPVHVLQYWIRGRLAPGQNATALERDADGHLTRFEQLGWAVELSRWRQSAAGTFPSRVRATRHDRRITVVCKEWLSD